MKIWEKKTKNHYHDGGLDIGPYCTFQKFYQWLQVSLPPILNETKLIKIYQGQPTDVTF